MSELTREEKLKLIEKLPQRLQDFLYSEDTGAFLLYLGQKYNLPDEKVSALSKIIADIILKIIPITGLAQEIANEVISDHQMAMSIAQELNTELLAPILMPTPVTPPIPTRQELAAGTPIPVERSIGAVLSPAAPQADQYREPTTGGPEIIDLRKTPPIPIQMPVTAAPIPPSPKPVTSPAAPPLTFTKPIELTKPKLSVKAIPPSMPLIEAEPHQKEEIKIPEPPKSPVMSFPTSLGASKVEPQFIVRPPGLSPTDFHSNVLDLRKDKGEF